MRLMGLLLVVVTAGALLHWYQPFEAVCGLAVLLMFCAMWWMMRHRRSGAVDEDELYELEPESTRAREFVLGIILGVGWLTVATITITALAKTGVHGWFVDEPGQALATELEMLARNGAWSSILTRFDRPLPTRLSSSARIRIDRLHYIALTHAAANIADPQTRCTAQREAGAFAEAKMIDPLDRIPFLCEPAAASGEGLARATVRILKQEQDAAGRTVVTVAVSDSSGIPLSQLDANSFVAVAQGREVSVASVVYAPSILPLPGVSWLLSGPCDRAHMPLPLKSSVVSFPACFVQPITWRH